MFDFLKPLAKSLLRSFANHAGTFAAGALTTVGAVVPGDTAKTATIIAGILSWALMQAWSWYDAHKKEGAITQAKAEAASLAEQNRAIVAATQQATGTDVPL